MSQPVFNPPQEPGDVDAIKRAIARTIIAVAKQQAERVQSQQKPTTPKD